MTIFGIVGYLLRKLQYEAAPLIFALVLSPILENSFRQALLMSEGSFEIFFIRPISAVLLIAGDPPFYYAYLAPVQTEKVER